MRVETIGQATLYLGDCLTVLPSIRADAIITDPPYGHGWKGIASTAPGGRNWSRRRSEAIQGHDAPFDPEPFLGFQDVILWGANHYASRLPDSAGWLVWDKRDGTASNNLSDVELAWHKRGGSARIFRHMWNGLCRDSEVGQHLHPTQKAVALMAWCMSFVPKAQVIFDPYMGSGTTGIAAVKAGKRFIGVEIHEPYFDVACERIENAQRQESLFA
jgi:site-specific DNA-methyltransferase (adenine-specific)